VSRKENIYLRYCLSSLLYILGRTLNIVVASCLLTILRSMLMYYQLMTLLKLKMI